MASTIDEGMNLGKELQSGRNVDALRYLRDPIDESEYAITTLARAAYRSRNDAIYTVSMTSRFLVTIDDNHINFSACFMGRMYLQLGSIKL